MTLVIVESPSKAKTIEQYLGKNFEVKSSYGHIRGLPSSTGAVLPDEDFKMKYEIPASSIKAVNNIIASLKKCNELYLATDPDREGEAISWHIYDILREKNLLKGKTVKRVVFHEITKKAVLAAIDNARDINEDLVHAQQSRQALDYLVGFNLSPVLWRKLPGSKSAGRVQSVALRLICEREEEIEQFKVQEYWSIEGEFSKASQKSDADNFKMRLIEYLGKKLDKLDIKNAEEAALIEKALIDRKYVVDAIERKEVLRNSVPPFTTSTMLQEASKKLGFSAKKTAKVAQTLYEGVAFDGKTVGLITYMRTDSLHISEDAITAFRDYIGSEFGPKYMPAKAKKYKNKSKNAQEAHEAIRPTDITLSPAKINKYLDADQAKLYNLIWKRALASQMSSAIMDAIYLDVIDDGKKSKFRVNGTTLKFDGFLVLYKDSIDKESLDTGALLPAVEIGEEVLLKTILKDQHFTQAPPRYTEASLVKKMEELGIGRPSTYPSIIATLTEREYANIDKKRFNATIRGRIVTSFLKIYFSDYVKYEFTANLEDTLDSVAKGETDYKKVLHDFWSPFKERIDEGMKLNAISVQASLEKDLSNFLFHNQDQNKCPKCGVGHLNLKFGKFGAFLGCSNYPECNYIDNIINSDPHQDSTEDKDGSQMSFPKLLGADEEGFEYSLKKGPYGTYVEKVRGKEVKRTSIPPSAQLNAVDLEFAKSLLKYPKSIGSMEDGTVVNIGIGRYGPYVENQKKYYSIKNIDINSVTLDAAIKIIIEGQAKAKTKPVVAKASAKPAKATKAKSTKPKKTKQKE